jgi:hypothetical protein
VSGTPRKERIVKRWTLSVTRVLLDRPPDRIGALLWRFVDEAQEAFAEALGKVVDFLEYLFEKLVLVRSHGG